MPSPERSSPLGLVFLHYFGGSARAWDPVIERLGGEYDYAAPDLRGFGNARALSGPYTVDAYADDVADLIAQHQFGRYIVIGHSMGGKIALALAARRPEGLEALVLLAPSPPSPEPINDRAAMLAAYGDHAAALAIAKKIIKRPLAPGLVDQVVGDMLRSAKPAWNAWVQEGSRENISAKVGRISVPTLVLSGTDDAAIPTGVLASKVMPCLSAGRLVIITAAGHLLPLETADDVVEAVETMARSRARSAQAVSS
jgi:pimeloyl-ACP methyl ester carboxylesterase